MAGFTVSGEVEGLSQLLKQLNNIPKNLRRKHLRRAVQAATKPIFDEARKGAKAVQDTGVLWRSIGRKLKLYRNATFALGIIGVRKGFGKQVVTRDGASIYRNPEKYLHLVELGRKVIEVVKKKVLSDGKTVFGKRVAAFGGVGFLRRAWMVGSQRSRAAMVPILNQGIAESIKGA